MIANVVWADDWPQVEVRHGAKDTWPVEYDAPGTDGPASTDTSFSESFTDAKIPPRFEFNHQPVDSGVSTEAGLHLKTVSNLPDDDFYRASNTLTWRTTGPSCTSTILLDVSSMADGDRAFLAVMQRMVNWAGVVKDGSSLSLVTRRGLDFNRPTTTLSTGRVTATVPMTGTKVWLRTTIDGRPNRGQSSFSYSFDDKDFKPLGTDFVAQTDGPGWFSGIRHGVGTYATKGLGGSITVSRIDFAVDGQPITGGGSQSSSIVPAQSVTAAPPAANNGTAVPAKVIPTTLSTTTTPSTKNDTSPLRVDAPPLQPSSKCKPRRRTRQQ